MINIYIYITHNNILTNNHKWTWKLLEYINISKTIITTQKKIKAQQHKIITKTHRQHKNKNKN